MAVERPTSSVISTHSDPTDVFRPHLKTSVLGRRTTTAGRVGSVRRGDDDQSSRSWWYVPPASNPIGRPRRLNCITPTGRITRRIDRCSFLHSDVWLWTKNQDAGISQPLGIQFNNCSFSKHTTSGCDLFGTVGIDNGTHTLKRTSTGFGRLRTARVERQGITTFGAGGYSVIRPVHQYG